MKKFFKQTIKFVLIAIFTLTCTLTWIPNSLGQISLFTTTNNNQTTSSPPWDLNKAYSCGKFWCSDVYIYDDATKIEYSLLNPELTLTVLKDLNQTTAEVSQQVEQRAKLVQRVFEQIFESIVSVKNVSEIPYIANWQFWLPTTEKPLHPWTPKIEVGIQNQQTVIYAPAQPELGLASEAIVTVTHIDAKANGKTVEELAEVWRNSIRHSFSNALWGHELDVQHPEWRWLISAVIMGITLALIWLIHLIRNLLRKWNNRLRRKLKQLNDSLAVDPEATSSQSQKSLEAQGPESLANQNSSEQDTPVATEKYSQNKFRGLDPLFSWLKKRLSFPLLQKLFNFLKKKARKNHWLSSKFHLSRQKLFLQHQTLIKQQRNFCQLCLRVMLILELLFLSLGLILIVLTFRQTRFLSVYLLKETLILIMAYMGLIFADKLGDFAIDYFLNRWASEAQIDDPSSNRYTLRVNTYSTTVKRATTFLTIVLGLYFTIWSMGIDPSVLAGAGVVAVAFAFLSRNLIEDMLNGILILCTDRYAIGDVIDIGGGISGTVEDINLFITSLRNLDGQLIAIPNSKISTVINSTKNWSRVNFFIRIAWNEDIDRAIAVITEVADQMHSEPEWREKFLETAEILGVDEVSHEGILIHLIIKTQPSEQWRVGREFRLRVKKALDQAGISVGIPYHKISVIHSQKDESNQLSSNVLFEQGQD